ncbi:MAG: hypothetical protein LKCHEGNO_00166 [Burkholderiaceae bacterium]|nr:hypothetical protein [Burkholderiaceae bacterium]
MSALYLMALAGVAVAIVGLAWDAVTSVARRPPWESSLRALTLVRTADRREHALPFVGGERRASAFQDTGRDRIAA